MQFQFLRLTQIWKIQNEITKLFKVTFLWSYGCTTHHSPAMYRKIWGTRLILRPCPEHYGFCVSSCCELDHKDTAHQSYRPGTRVHKTHNSAPLSSLSNSICRHKENVLLLRNVAWYIFPVASLCNLLNQTYFLTANVKFPGCQHKIQVTQIKSL